MGEDDTSQKSITRPDDVHDIGRQGREVDDIRFRALDHAVGAQGDEHFINPFGIQFLRGFENVVFTCYGLSFGQIAF